MKTKLTQLADQVAVWAARIVLHGGEPPGPDEIRAMADRVSGGELDTIPLDIVCSMAERRIEKWLKP